MNEHVSFELDKRKKLWSCTCFIEQLATETILFLTDSCFFNLLLHVFFSPGSVTTGILKQKTLSLTAAVCMTELRRWSWTLPLLLASLQSFQSTAQFYNVVELESVLAGGDGMRQ